MDKGIIYLMTTAVSGLIKIGIAKTDRYRERMRFLEANGYYNVVSLKRFFAIEVDDYKEKERLLQEVFAKHRVAESELFSLDIDLVKQLLLAFEGKVIYPEEESREKQFEEISEFREQEKRFNFYRKGLKDGDKIQFIKDTSIEAVVVGAREVKCGGMKYKLSPLVRNLFEARGEANGSGSYRGAAHFSYRGIRLIDLPDIT